LVRVCSGLSSRENVVSLLDTVAEVSPVGHHVLDVVQLEIDEHTSDLWSLLWSQELLDVLEEHVTSLVLVVWILDNHSWEDLVAVGDESLVHWKHLLLLLLLLLLLHLHLHLLLHVLHMLHVLVLHVLVHPVLSVWAATLVLHVLWMHASWALSASWDSLVLHHLSLWWSVDEGWEALQKELEVVLDILVVSESGPVGSLVVLSSELLEVISVLGSLVVDFSDFLDLIMVDGQGLTLELLVVKLLLSR